MDPEDAIVRSLPFIVILALLVGIAFAADGAAEREKRRVDLLKRFEKVAGELPDRSRLAAPDLKVGVHDLAYADA